MLLKAAYILRMSLIFNNKTFATIAGEKISVKGASQLPVEYVTPATYVSC
jgi:hypothetical protein